LFKSVPFGAPSGAAATGVLGLHDGEAAKNN